MKIHHATPEGTMPAGPPPGLLDLRFAQLEELLAGDGLSRTHALPLFRALHQQLEQRPQDRHEFPPPLKRWLADPASPTVGQANIAEVTASSDGWTRKFLVRFADQTRVEAVLMGFPGRFTACLSSQVGCAMGCVFCATGRIGFTRHLQPAEIVAQALAIERFVRHHHRERVRNLVLMGMGEPLHNFGHTMQALDILTDTRGLNIGPARVTISTVGHVPGIRRLARHPKCYSLAVSLHGTDDHERQSLVPVNRRWPLDELLEACREFSALKRQRVFVAWTLIGGLNDGDTHARRLANLLRGIDVHVNLIPLNPVEGFQGEAPDPRRVAAFQKILQSVGLPSTVRQRRGIDVNAGCGQLAGRV